jgi:hypothetical protein
METVRKRAIIRTVGKPDFARDPAGPEMADEDEGYVAHTSSEQRALAGPAAK